MRISVFITMLIMVGVVLFVISAMVNEGSDTYGVDINTSQYEGEYDFVNQINEEVTPIKESIDTIGNEEKGFLEKVGAGFTGIISAVTLLPVMVWNVALLGSGLITGIGAGFGLPPYITLALIVSLTVWGIFKLIEFYQRWQI